MRRTKIRAASFAAALFVSLLAWGITGSVTARHYQREARAARERSLLQACEYLDGMQVSLQKAGYAAGPAMLGEIASALRTQANGAMASLTGLSAGETQMYNVYKFLTQAAAYTESIQRRAAAGEEIPLADRHTLQELLGYAKSLSTQFGYMAQLLDAGLFSFEELNAALAQTDESTADMVSYLGAAADAEDSFKDFPTLIYDGPYSDNITNKTSALLAAAPAVSEAEARAVAARMLGASQSLLVSAGAAAGRLPVYCFYKDGFRAAVTVNGGYPAYVLSDKTVGEAKLGRRQAREAAEDYLRKMGYTDMEPTYSADENGVCIFNFAYRQGDYTCYPDLIKVGVSLADGKVTSMDARDYIMNHIPRDIPAEALTAQEAAGRAAEGITVKRVSRAVIPTGGGNEKFAYELRCTARDGQDLLVYVDTVTGQEDDILLLLYTDGGALTK